jgi:hypothetical protein
MVSSSDNPVSLKNSEVGIIIQVCGTNSGLSGTSLREVCAERCRLNAIRREKRGSLVFMM